MLVLTQSLPATVLAAIGLRDILADIPVSGGAIFLYVLVIASVSLVFYFGLKKPGGPGDVSGA